MHRFDRYFCLNFMQIYRLCEYTHGSDDHGLISQEVGFHLFQWIIIIIFHLIVVCLWIQSSPFILYSFPLSERNIGPFFHSHRALNRRIATENWFLMSKLFIRAFTVWPHQSNQSRNPVIIHGSRSRNASNQQLYGLTAFFEISQKLALEINSDDDSIRRSLRDTERKTCFSFIVQSIYGFHGNLWTHQATVKSIRMYHRLTAYTLNATAVCIVHVFEMSMFFFTIVPFCYVKPRLAI